MNCYFWRTHQQQELDYIEEKGGTIQAYEFKWKSGKERTPKAFLDAYPGSPVEFVTHENFESFVGI